MADQLLWSRVLRAVTDPGSAPPGFPLLAAVVSLGMDVSPDSVGCSITVPRGGGFVTPVATGPVAAELDAAQYRAGAGPCIAAARDGQVHDVDVATSPAEFAGFAAAARAHGVRASLSWPLPVAPRSAALNLYAGTVGAFSTRRSRAVAALLSRVVTAAMASRTAAPGHGGGGTTGSGGQDTRTVVLAAIDTLTAVGGVRREAAFEHLARRSAAEHRGLGEVARAVLTEQRGDLR